MSVTKYNNRPTIFQNKAQWQRNTWGIALKKTQMNRIQPRWLRSGITISLLTTSISRICSHQ